MRKIRTISAGLIALLIGTLVIFSTGMQAGPGHMGRRGQTRMDNFDRHFIEEMIPHHEEAVRMADLALRKAEHRRLKRLAADIKRTQTKEIKDMRSWYRTWYGQGVPEEPDGMGHDATDIKKLKNAKPFDKEFIEQMVPHHRMAVMMAGMARRRAEREEIRTLSRDIIASQSREIRMMRRWYRQWYGSNK